jgi:hypothetical protein
VPELRLTPPDDGSRDCRSRAGCRPVRRSDRDLRRQGELVFGIIGLVDDAKLEPARERFADDVMVNDERNSQILAHPPSWRLVEDQAVSPR